MTPGQPVSSQSISPASIVGEKRRNLWRSNPQRMAWVILLVAFSVFTFLAVSIPLTIRYTLQYATVAQDIHFNPTMGTILFYPARAREPIAITSARNDIGEGSRIETASYSTQGELGLTLVPDSDRVLGTIHLYSGTQLELLRVRRPRFESSIQPYYVRFRLNSGHIRLFTTNSEERLLLVEVETPHGQTLLGEGVYNFSVNAEYTEISVNAGKADLLHASGAAMAVSTGLRSRMSLNDPPSIPVTAQRNLINNGDFSQPFLNTWETTTVASENVVPGKVEVVNLDGRRVARFMRRGEADVHTEVGIWQPVNQDVNVYELLRLDLDVKIDFQSLQGAGWAGTEFPVRVEIDYTSIYGQDLKWGHGFYYRPPEPGWPLQGGEMIPRDRWFFYPSPNLFEVLKDTRPARINSIRIYASGHNYEAMVSGISLIVE
jgi:hypothetical protein